MNLSSSSSSPLSTVGVDVIILGSGTSALALALALSGSSASPQGVRVALVATEPPPPLSHDPPFLPQHPEQHNESHPPQHDDRAFALSETSLCLLENLGISELLTDSMFPVSRIDISDGLPDDPLRLPFLSFDTLSDNLSTSLSIVLGQSLFQALHSAVLSVPSIIRRTVPSPFSILPGTHFTHPSVSFADGSSFHAPLLVIADGADSPSRNHLAIPCYSYDTCQHGMTASLSLESDHHGIATQHFLPSGPCALLPLQPFHASLVWTLDSDRLPFLRSLSFPELEDAISRHAGCQFGRLSLRSRVRSRPLRFQIASSFISDRCALVGDAAHVIHPLSGQGLNLAFRDVAALAESILDAARIGIDPGSLQVLQRYQQWRYPDTVALMSSTAALGRIFADNADIPRFLRDFGMSFLDRSPVIKQYLIHEASGKFGDLPSLLTLRNAPPLFPQ